MHGTGKFILNRKPNMSFICNMSSININQDNVVTTRNSDFANEALNIILF